MKAKNKTITYKFKTKYSTRSKVCTRNLSTFSYMQALTSFFARQYWTAPLIFTLRVASIHFSKRPEMQKTIVVHHFFKTLEAICFKTLQSYTSSEDKELVPFKVILHFLLCMPLEAYKRLPPLSCHLLDLCVAFQSKNVLSL